jgi:hypothetical protein
MKFSPMVRRTASVLVIVFVLTTIWVAYSIYTESRSVSPAPPTSVATYSEEGSNSFIADLTPSYLYNNSTVITGGNTTLFTPITNWINASLTYSIGVNGTVAISLSGRFVVTLSTPVWSRTLFTASNSTSLSATRLATFAFQYAINVSNVVALAQAIDTQLDYSGLGYTLSLDPEISGQIEVAGGTYPVALEPRLNFTFSGSLIKPNGLNYTSTGSLFTSGHTGPADGPGSTVLTLALIGSVGSLCGCAWVASRRADEISEESLEKIIQPYEEIVATVAQGPMEATATNVATFPDLVKIADTLGKPILRPTGPDPTRRTFFVLDGSVAYRYRHQGSGGTVKPSRNTFSPPSPPTRSSGNETLAQKLRLQVKRLEGLSLDATTATLVRQRVRRAVDLIHAGRDEEAAEEIEALSRISSASRHPSRRPQ